MHACVCECQFVSRINSLFLYLSSLRVLQLLGLAHVHEEILQQPLGLRQVVCVHLLVDHGLILPIALRVLHSSKRSRWADLMTHLNRKNKEKYILFCTFTITEMTYCIFTTKTKLIKEKWKLSLRFYGSKLIK